MHTDVRDRYRARARPRAASPAGWEGSKGRIVLDIPWDLSISKKRARKGRCWGKSVDDVAILSSNDILMYSARHLLYYPHSLCFHRVHECKDISRQSLLSKCRVPKRDLALDAGTNVSGLYIHFRCACDA